MIDETTFIRGLYPIREGRDIFVERDGVRIKLAPLQASLLAQAWLAAISGAYVANKNQTDDFYQAFSSGLNLSV